MGDKQLDGFWVNSSQLLVPQRLDIGFRLLFLRMYGTNPATAGDFYWEGVRVQLGNSEVDPRNSSKRGRNQFISSFLRTIDSIESKGFDPAESRVLLAKDGSLLDGAHRVAICVRLGLPVFAEKTGEEPLLNDARYFLGRGVSRDLIRSCVREIARWAPRTRVAFAWPRGGKKATELLKERLPQVLYQETIELSHQSVRSLIYLAYGHMEWVYESMFPSPVEVKALQSFGTKRVVTIFVFIDDHGNEWLRKLKKRIRSNFAPALSVLHVTDSYEEANRILPFVLSETSLEYFNGLELNAQSWLKGLKPMTGATSLLKCREIALDNHLELNQKEVSDTIRSSEEFLSVFSFLIRPTHRFFQESAESADKFSDFVEWPPTWISNSSMTHQTSGFTIESGGCFCSRRRARPLFSTVLSDHALMAYVRIRQSLIKSLEALHLANFVRRARRNLSGR